jgi:hypothetical protein
MKEADRKLKDIAKSEPMKLISAPPSLIVAMAVVVAAHTAPALAQDSFTRARRAAALKTERHGDLPLGAVLRTDERYNHGLFKGPRGWAYWNYLENPKPYQNPNLWPDKRPTYFFGQLAMPAGSSLTIHGRFPYVRYFKFSLYEFERQTFVAVASGSLAGYDIEPDPGSGNPYRVGADRLVKSRNFTLHVIAEDAPKGAERPKNSVYVGREGKELMAGFRFYLSDQGYDGTGWGPADIPSPDGSGITYEGKLADGTVLSAEEVDKRFSRPMGSAPPPLTINQWYALVDAKDNDPSLTAATAPARPDAAWEIFRGMRYTVVGAFKTAQARAKMPLQKEMEGGGDPTTAYMVTYLSRKFGSVYVFRAKMPTFPNTFAGTKVMPDGQVKYWSVVSVASAPSGELWDGVFDMQASLDKDGYYTIVVSRPEDRPKNATRENGVTWMDWGPGEGLDDRRNRKDWGMLIMRFMVCHADWENSPEKAMKPGSEASVMGAYYPRGYYTIKAQFEADGLKK